MVEQESNAQCRPTAFFSAKHSPTQSRHSTFSRELLAIYMAIKLFWHLLKGRHFSIFTDHKPLTTAMQNSSDKYTAHELRHLDYISQFTIDLRYIKSENSTAADTLSRNSTPSTMTCQDLIADEQKCDSTLPSVLSDNSLALQKFPAPFSHKTLYCDVKSWPPKPYIPPPLRKRVFRHLHRLSHPSKRATVKLIADGFVWPNMNSDVREWVSEFLECQKRSVQRHTKSTIGTFSKSSDVYVPHHLQECEFVFVRNDTMRRPLTPTHTGPFKVLNRADKRVAAIDLFPFANQCPC